MLSKRSLNSFWTRVEKSLEPNGCWMWTGELRFNGYGDFRTRPGITRRAHILAYMLLNGEVPEGLVLDHTCHNADRTCAGGPTCLHRRCVNPSHLEAVERGENVMRGRTLAAANAAKTHCRRGHAFDSANTVVNARGWRHCLTCRRATAIERYHRRRQLEVV